MTAMGTEVQINISGVDRSAADFTSWPLKKEAVATLKALRDRGLNTDDCIRIHPAHNRFFRFWLITRPDENGEMTWLMRADGSWIRGRLFDGWTEATWTHIPPADNKPIPPTFTHITSTVPHHARAERYRTKSNGSCGRWVRDDDSVALCTCGWTSHAGSRPEARLAARAHRSGEMAANRG